MIAWSSLNVKYYGVRYAKNTEPADFWVTYFTSSKIVRKFVELYGDPDIKRIRKTFKTKEEACNWETRVLTRLKVKSRKDWLNQSENSGFIGSSNKSGRPKGLTNAKDAFGNIYVVHVNDPRLKTGEFVHPTKGTKTVFDTVTHNFIRVPVSEKDIRYQSVNKNHRVVLEKETNTYVRIKINDFDEKKHEVMKRDYKPLTEEQRKVKSDIMKGEKNPMYGKPGTFLGKTHKKESIEKYHETLRIKKESGWVNPNTGKKRPDWKKRWFNNGSISVLVEPGNEPTGFKPGRHSKKK
jgi:hypothetical protein